MYLWTSCLTGLEDYTPTMNKNELKYVLEDNKVWFSGIEFESVWKERIHVYLTMHVWSRSGRYTNVS